MTSVPYKHLTTKEKASVDFKYAYLRKKYYELTAKHSISVIDSKCFKAKTNREKKRKKNPTQ